MWLPQRIEKNTPHANTRGKHHLATHPDLCKSFPFFIFFSFHFFPFYSATEVLFLFPTTYHRSTNEGNASDRQLTIRVVAKKALNKVECKFLFSPIYNNYSSNNMPSWWYEKCKISTPLSRSADLGDIAVLTACSSSMKIFGQIISPKEAPARLLSGGKCIVYAVNERGEKS